MDVRWRKNPGLQAALVGAIAFLVIGLVLNLHRYYTFYASYDQGIFNQLFWNTIHGHWFQSSLSSNLSTNVVHAGEVPDVAYRRLGQHFTPALLLWMPLYALFPSPVTLTVLQMALLTAAGVVLYALAAHRLHPAIAAMIALSFYGANTVIGPALGNFHDLCQVPLLVFGLLLALEKQRWGWVGLLALLIPLVREDAGITLFGIGVFLLVRRWHPRVGLLFCVYSVGYMLALTNVVMPLFSDDVSRRFLIEMFGQYVEGDQASTFDVVRGMLSNPLRLIVELVSPVSKTLRYLLGHWLPLAFVPAIAPDAWLIALFPLLKILLADGDDVLSVTIRYSLSVLPGFFYGAILWWSRHPRMFSPIVQQVWAGCICLSLLLSVTSNPNRTLSFIIPDSIDPWVSVPLVEQWQHAAEIRQVLPLIPADASVSATMYVMPQLSSRREIVHFPRLNLRNDARAEVMVDYAIADLWQLYRYQPAFESDRTKLRLGVRLINRLLKQQTYGLIAIADGVVVLKRRATSSASALEQWQAFKVAIASANPEG